MIADTTFLSDFRRERERTTLFARSLLPGKSLLWRVSIRRMAPSGFVTTIAGLAGIAGNQNGTGTTARFNDPHAMDMDSLGLIYIADTSNNSIRKGVPGFACPTNMMITAPAGQNTIPVTYATPTAPPGTRVTCSPPSGAIFSEGTTVVTCSAISFTNSVTCTFTVTVVVLPSITVQPESIDVTAGQTLSLSVLASGSAPPFLCLAF
jgi:hypothetical protein